MKLHPVFCVSQLEPAIENPMEGRIVPPPPPVIVDRKVEYEVNEIHNSWMNQQQLESFVKWSEYEDLEWIYAQDVDKIEVVDCFTPYT